MLNFFSVLLEDQRASSFWETALPGLTNATACTYEVSVKQYVAISVDGTKKNLSGSIMELRYRRWKK